MELAIIKIGGKQYLVFPGKKIKVEKINKKEGEEITFSDVLLLRKGKKLKIGNPLVEGAKVIGKVLKQEKGEKVIVFKHRPRSSYRVKRGHRQLLSQIEILKIED
jgi:large subunit ribosomal protein L21